jgi:hypoxanthine phosphoribosyltransferase
MIDEKNFTRFLSKPEIEATVQTLAAKINQDYEGKGRIVLVAVLKGALVFSADLARQLKVDHEIEFVRMATHGKSRASNGTVTLLKDISTDIQGRHVLIVEEIIDSGRTLKFLYDRLRLARPASVEIVTLFDKAKRRVADIQAKYVGRTIEDQFLIGYGLDLEEKARNLQEVFSLKYPN